MKITQKNTDRPTVFDDLSPGDIFSIKGEGFFMKIQTNETADGPVNAVCLREFTFCCFKKSDPVILHNSELIVS